MRRYRLYTPQNLQTGQLIELQGSALQHLKVLRVKPGHQLTLFNGQSAGVDGSGEYDAELIKIDNKRAEIKVLNFHTFDRESPLQTHLGLALSKGDRFEIALQKAVELGVTRITPLWSERTEVKLPKERLQKRLQHWQNLIISASEQCQRTAIAQLNNPITLNDFVLTTSLCTPNQQQLSLVLAPKTQETASSSLKSQLLSSSMPNSQLPKQINLLIGPEGGLSQSEINHAITNDYCAVHLGPRILRTETAPLSILSALQYQWGDW